MSAQPTDADLLPFGYVRGDYTVRCHVCRIMMAWGDADGGMDKYATSCRPCAVKAWRKQTAIEDAPLACDFPDMAG